MTDERMKIICAAAEPLRITADFIQRNQSVVNIKGRIFKAFGRQRSRQLLELNNDFFNILRRPGIVFAGLPTDLFKQQIFD